MDISDRIQQLRRIKGISQEELADKIGVSRQAVSKWESEQSIPDIDKIIAMSEYFSVTTDYILKGIEQPKQIEKKVNANIFVIVATVLNFIGLIISAAIWAGNQMPIAIGIGLAIMALGCMVFGIGTLESSESTKESAKYNFWSVNIWILTFIPLSVIYNVLYLGMAAPYPILTSIYFVYGIFWLIYFAICLSVNMILLIKKRKK